MLAVAAAGHWPAGVPHNGGGGRIPSHDEAPGHVHGSSSHGLRRQYAVLPRHPDLVSPHAEGAS